MKVVRETFVKKICSNHHVSSPCQCGEPLNNTARRLFEPQETFDPFGLNPNRIAALSVFVASISVWLSQNQCLQVDFGGLRVSKSNEVKVEV